MIIINILLVFITGLLILWLFKQYKYLNIFEQISLGFGIGLSLFVFELFIGGIVFDKLSMIGPIITFLILLGIFIYFSFKKNIAKKLISNIKKNLIELKKGINDLKLWQKVVGIFIILYVLLKIFMVFSINTSMPTFDEDSVTGWDVKTKVFLENKSLVLDKENIEYMGSALSRNIFAPLTDTYFLLGYNKFPVGLSNIISPLIYLCIIFMLFGILLRKTGLIYALISIYIFTSIPFLFIHGFASYFNFISGFFLFTFAFYLSDQIFSINRQEINKGIVIPLGIFAFLDASIRNESMLLMLAIFLLEIIIFYIYHKKGFSFKKNTFVFLSLIGLVLSFLVNKYINYISPQKIADISSNLEGGIISKFFENISKPGVFTAPFNQSFLHTDYNLLYLLFTISLIIFIFKFKRLKEIQSIMFSSLLLLSIFVIILFINVDELGLLTHFSFVRYPIAITLFLVYIVTYFIYFIFGKNENRL